MPTGNWFLASWKFCSASMICRVLLAQLLRRADSRAACTAGRSRPTSPPMIAITTSSSTSVKPRRCRNARGQSIGPAKSTFVSMVVSLSKEPPIVMALSLALRPQQDYLLGILPPPVVAILQKQDTGVIARKGDAATPVRHGMCASHSLITGLLRFCWVRNTGSLARASGLPGTPLHPSPQRERGNTGRLQIRCRTGVGRSTAPLWRPSPFARPLSVR